MKKILFVFAFAFCVWFSFGSVSLADSNEAPNGESYNFVYHYYGNWTYQNFVYDAVYYTNLPLAAYNNKFYCSVDGELIMLDLSTNAPGVYTNALDVFRYNGNPSKTIDHCIYVKSGQKGYAMSPNPNYPAIQTDIPIFSDMDEMLIYLQSQNEIDFSEAVYTPDMGHLVGIDKGFKRYILNHTDYAEFSWFSETSGGYELLDDYYDDSMIEIKLIPHGKFQNNFNKKVTDFDTLNRFYVYDVRYKSKTDEYTSIFDNFTNLRMNIDSLFESDGVLYEWYQGFLSARPNVFYSCTTYFDIYFTPYVLAEGTLYYGDTVCVTDNTSDPSAPYNYTVTFGHLSDPVDQEDPLSQSFITDGTSISSGYTIGEGNTYSEAVINAGTNNSVDITLDNWNHTVTSLTSQIGQVPALFNSIFGFLPSWVIQMLALTIGALCIFRILGR